MNPMIRNILAVLAGAILGSMVNMGIIMLSSSIIPPPEGADLTTEAGLKASMHLMQPKHFIMPFLAHALGTLAGAFVTAIIALSHKMNLALAIGVLFLAGGISMVFMLPSPIWFTLLDLIGAYLPMAYLGGKLAIKKSPLI
ncbi:MAG: hypothetical protein JNK69_07020 [Saprospiraceae bacterium]|nr:hypothetical protein [Candidatus Vicinibacter proximus]MBL7823143.1 hypothetical protein [Saprospiraceae bacterium]MCC6842534.1 hypothetical protein [Saprospiraceae bacterium]HRG32114.1 hypothetical protein [Saprospiraceae bacterium]